MTSTNETKNTFSGKIVFIDSHINGSPTASYKDRLPAYSYGANAVQYEENHDEIRESSNMHILEKYIDKMDRDQSDLRNDIRESEKRTERRIERLEQIILDQNETINRRFDTLEQKYEKTEASLDAKIANMENRFLNLESRVGSIKTWLLGTSIATVLSIGAMVVAIVFGIPSLVQAIIMAP